MTANVLGTEYEILYKDYADDAQFSENDFCGYCDDVLKTIVICNMQTYPGFELETEEYCKEHQKYTLRHELIHAFLSESGLSHSSGKITNIGWAKNEEMVDFFAIQFPKIKKVFEELKII